MSPAITKKKVLICDDEEGIRESLKLILGDTYNLIVVNDGQQCIECLRNSKDIGVLLLDIKMPQTTGLDVLPQAKAMRPDLKVIVVTGYKSQETATEAAHRGADGYIIKPFKSEDILATVKKHLN
jgi:DNA-binding NtrC family response regulator